MMLHLEKKKINLATGEQYAYVEYGHGPHEVVLLHGNMSSGLHYLPLIERLDAEKFHVIAPDMRGFGDSSYNHRFDSLQALKDDVTALVKALNLTSLTVAGWSAGGGVALLLAAQEPSLVKRLFLIDSMSYKGMPVFKKDAKGAPLWGQVYASKEELALDPIQVAPAVKALSEGNIAFMDYIWNLVIYTVNKPSKEANELYLKETMKQRNLVDFDWSLVNFNMGIGSNFQVPGDHSIAKVSCPVLSVWGQQDKTVWEVMVRETIGALGQKGRLIVYDQCGHSPLVDVPDKLAHDFISFAISA